MYPQTPWFVVQYMCVFPFGGMAGTDGFEPSECQSQSLVPYHLATSQYIKDGGPLRTRTSDHPVMSREL